MEQFTSVTMRCFDKLSMTRFNIGKLIHCYIVTLVSLFCFTQS